MSKLAELAKIAMKDSEKIVRDNEKIVRDSEISENSDER